MKEWLNFLKSIFKSKEIDKPATEAQIAEHVRTSYLTHIHTFEKCLNDSPDAKLVEMHEICVDMYNDMIKDPLARQSTFIHCTKWVLNDIAMTLNRDPYMYLKDYNSHLMKLYCEKYMKL